MKVAEAGNGLSGNGCQSEKQKEKYPWGRIRLVQFIAASVVQGCILAWVNSFDRLNRHRAIWHLLEIGWKHLHHEKRFLIVTKPLFTKSVDADQGNSEP